MKKLIIFLGILFLLVYSARLYGQTKIDKIAQLDKSIGLSNSIESSTNPNSASYSLTSVSTSDSNEEFHYLSDLTWTTYQDLDKTPGGGIPLLDSMPGPWEHGVERNIIAGIHTGSMSFEKGVFGWPKWRREEGFVEYTLDKKYTRFETWAGLSIHAGNPKQFEWGLMVPETGEFKKLERPNGKYGGPEDETHWRIGWGGKILIIGDDVVLAETKHFKAWDEPEHFEIDVENVSILRIVFSSEKEETADRPYRRGLTGCPKIVTHSVYHSELCLGDAKLYLKEQSK